MSFWKLSGCATCDMFLFSLAGYILSAMIIIEYGAIFPAVCWLICLLHIVAGKFFVR